MWPIGKDFSATGNLQEDVSRFLLSFSHAETLGHCLRVAQTAKELAERFGADPLEAEQAALLHDLGAVIPREEKLAFSRRHDLPVLPEEEQYPGVLHQQHSVVLARCFFGISDDRLLNAIGCHTTLQAGASTLGQVVFLADKMSWDQDGHPPFLPAVQAALAESLAAGCLTYIDWLLGPAGGIVVIHPWLLAAKHDLARRVQLQRTRNGGVSDGLDSALGDS